MTESHSTDPHAEPQLLDREELRARIRDKYREVALDPTARYHFFTGRAAAEHVGYADGALRGLPDAVVEAFAGVANPFHWGLPGPGETVVDVGSGGGLDAVIAARATGDSGHVIGIDMTEDMLDRARSSVESLSLLHLEFRQGTAEDLPIEDASVDLVISNGVLNLVPDKLAAYREIARVLRPGGRFQIADIMVSKPIPEGVQRDIDLWTG